MSQDGKSAQRPHAAEYLSEAHAGHEEITVEWDQDNQQWWNWYMSLAENDPSDTGSISPADAIVEAEEVEIPAGVIADLDAHLAEPYDVPQEAVAAFNRDGYIKLKNVLDPQALTIARRRVTSLLLRTLGEDHDLSFRSDEMMWLHDDLLRRFTLSPRIAKIAADLLRVKGIRLYHDNILSKEPGCGRTPWHYDYHHFPIDSFNVCTAWIPLQAIPEEMGPLGFAVGMETYKLVEDLPFNKFDVSYDQELGRAFDENNITVHDGPFDIGEISFHHTLSFHNAGPNRTRQSRMALANTYLEDGARLVANPTMISGDFRKFMPGIEPGEVINSDYNPVCYPVPSGG